MRNKLLSYRLFKSCLFSSSLFVVAVGNFAIMTRKFSFVRHIFLLGNKTEGYVFFIFIFLILLHKLAFGGLIVSFYKFVSGQ